VPLGFVREYRRRRAIFAGITCIHCGSSDTELVGRWYRRRRHCRVCDETWAQNSGFWIWYSAGE
jgi:hypothetical protein